MENFLPNFDYLPAVRKGRSPRDGYQRATMRYSGLFENVVQEKDFQEAYSLIKNRTLTNIHRLVNLYLLIRFYMPNNEPGDIIEYGSYKGGSAVFMAYLSNKYLKDSHVFALDTFEGMPDTDHSIDGHHKGDFSDVDFDEVVQFGKPFRNLTFVKGLFEVSVPHILSGSRRVSLAHIDCDIYHACLYCWNSTKPFMNNYGYIVFDDSTEGTCLGATEAVEDIIMNERMWSEQVDPHFVFRFPPLPT